MTENTRIGLPELKPLRGTGATLFAATGFAAAFGAASCCALPVLLGSRLASLARFHLNARLLAGAAISRRRPALRLPIQWQRHGGQGFHC